MPLSLRWSVARAANLIAGLSDPAMQPKFVNRVPDALAPAFKYASNAQGEFDVQVRAAMQYTGLVDANGTPLATPVWGYADRNRSPRLATWPGKTFEVLSTRAGGPAVTVVKWTSGLKPPMQHLLPVDTNLHWCYSLPGYEGFTIENDGVPIITHLHGGHSDFQYDGNPEFFYNAYENVVGPQWAGTPGGFTTKFQYDNNVRAGNLWYHDHALGITRLNVYAGLAGFYFIRDQYDTGKPDNPIGLPAWPYEKAYAIQDRMFRDTGELFYPAFPGDPAYDDFIIGEDATLPDGLFPDGGPTALAEFFGDHMVVNGVIWPVEDVEPRHYRLRLLNGTDSRFMRIQLRQVALGETDPAMSSKGPLEFDVIGSDQGLASHATSVTQLLIEPGSRYDIVVDFQKLRGCRVIMENTLGDAPFGGEDPDPDADFYPDRQTNRVMAFDVVQDRDRRVADNYSRRGFDNGGQKNGSAPWTYAGNTREATRVRKVALFEGKDEFGRLQPLLGFWDPGDGLFKGVPWHMPTTENPALGATEIWEIHNFTGDAHPIHLHLVNFQVLSRRFLTWEEDGSTLPVMQHNGTEGVHPKVDNVAEVAGPDGDVLLGPADGYVENTPKDMVTCLPGQVTRIKATFDKPGRYVWHCHILSHEDHEMMRVLHVGPGA
jgi:spore coat protein A